MDPIEVEVSVSTNTIETVLFRTRDSGGLSVMLRQAAEYLDQNELTTDDVDGLTFGIYNDDEGTFYYVELELVEEQ